MFYVNKVILVGNLAKMNELKHSKGGTAILNFSLATNRSIKRGENDWEDIATFHRVVAFGKRAEWIKDCKVGEKLYVEGRIDYNKYQDKNGVEKYSTDIVADNIITFTKRDKSGENIEPHKENQSVDSMSQEPQEKSEEINLEDIPF